MKKMTTNLAAILCAACAATANAQNAKQVFFSGDANCGISSNKTYTHTVSLGRCEDWVNVSVKGVPFYRVTVNPATNPDQIYTLPGTGYTFSGITPNIHQGGDAATNIATKASAEVYKLLYDFGFNTPDKTLVLGGLTPGKCMSSVCTSVAGAPATAAPC